MLAPNLVQASNSESMADKAHDATGRQLGAVTGGASGLIVTPCESQTAADTGNKMAYPEGLEPPTSWSVARHSIQLSHGYAWGKCDVYYHTPARRTNRPAVKRMSVAGISRYAEAPTG